jgi:hypothetical protein
MYPCILHRIYLLNSLSNVLDFTSIGPHITSKIVSDVVLLAYDQPLLTFSQRKPQEWTLKFSFFRCLGTRITLTPLKPSLPLPPIFLEHSCIYYPHLSHYWSNANFIWYINHFNPWADPGGAGGFVPPYSGGKCPFCRRVPFSMFVPLLLETPNNASRPVSDKYSV